MSSPRVGRAVVGYFRNWGTLELRFYDVRENPLDEVMLATEPLSPRRAIEIAGKLPQAAYQALGDRVGPDEIRVQDFAGPQ